MLDHTSDTKLFQSDGNLSVKRWRTTTAIIKSVMHAFCYLVPTSAVPSVGRAEAQQRQGVHHDRFPNQRRHGSAEVSGNVLAANREGEQHRHLPILPSACRPKCRASSCRTPVLADRRCCNSVHRFKVQSSACWTLSHCVILRRT